MYEISYLVTLPLYALSVYYLCGVLFTKRASSKNAERVSYLLYAEILLTLFFTIRVPGIFLTANMVGIFLLSLLYEGSMIRRIACVLLVCSTMGVAEIIAGTFVGHVKIHAFANNDFDSVIVMALNRISVFIVARVAYRFKRNERRLYKIPSYYYVAHVVILAGTIYLFTLLLDKATLTIPQVIVSGLVLLLVNGLIVFLDEKIYAAIRSQYEAETWRQQNVAYESQMELINQSMVTVKTLKHDMKNHFLFLQAAYENRKEEEFEAYMLQIMDKMDHAKHWMNSGNFVVDSIVNFKLQTLQDMDVDVQLVAELPPELAVSSFDLVIILGNLLDNAITALGQAQGQKKLSLHITYSKGSLIILLDNSYCGSLVVEGGQFKTTKRQVQNHGIGLNHIKQTVEQCGGELEIEYTQDVFSVATLLPTAGQK